jgi:hypothetical protein
MTIVAVKKQCVTYSECMSVALVMQHTKRMRCTVLSSVACPAVPPFSTLSHNWPDFRKQSFEDKICILILSAISV